MANQALGRRGGLAGNRLARLEVNQCRRVIDASLDKAIAFIMAVVMGQRRSTLDAHQQRRDHTQRQPSPIRRGRYAAMMTVQIGRAHV